MKKVIYIIRLILFILASLSTFGQDFKEDSTFKTVLGLYQMSLDELLTLKVNSVSKFEEDIKDITHSVQIITKNDIIKYGYRSIAEALQHVSGFYMVDDHYCYKENFGIRGFYRDEWNQDVVFLVNGVRQRNGDSFNNPLSFINIPIQSIERIEIIKGASSVTYGTGAFMGVINIVTLCDYNKTEAYASIGSQNTLNAGFNLSRKIEDLKIAINVGIGKTDGINQNYSEMGLDTSLMSGKFMHEQYGYFSISAKSKNFFSSLSLDRNVNSRPVASPPFISSIYEQETNFIAVRYILGVNVQIKEWLETNASYQFQLQEENFFYDLFGLNNNLETQNSRVNSNEFDFNLKAHFSKNIYSAIGINIFKVSRINGVMDIPLLGLSNFYSSLKNPMNITGIYYRMGWDIFSKLKVRSGIRFDKTNQFTEERKYNLGNSVIDPQGQVLDSTYYREFRYPEYGIQIIPEFSVIYSIDNKHSLKFIYGEAINQPPPFKTKDASQGIKPEYIRNIEINHIGIFTDKLKINSSLFYNHYFNMISMEFRIKDNVPVQSATNSGEISTIGLESELQFQPSKKMGISFALNYNYSKDLKHKNVYPAFSPKFIGVFNASYQFSSLIIGLTNQFVSSTEPKFSFELTNPSDINSKPIGRVGKAAPAYINTGFNFRYSPLKLKFLYFNLRISNLLNQKMYYPVNDYNAWATRGTLGIGRTILFTLGYNLNKQY